MRLIQFVPFMRHACQLANFPKRERKSILENCKRMRFRDPKHKARESRSPLIAQALVPRRIWAMPLDRTDIVWGTNAGVDADFCTRAALRAGSGLSLENDSGRRR